MKNLLLRFPKLVLWLQGCSDWFPGCCYMVASVFWLVDGLLLCSCLGVLVGFQSVAIWLLERSGF